MLAGLGKGRKTGRGELSSERAFRERLLRSDEHGHPAQHSADDAEHHSAAHQIAEAASHESKNLCHDAPLQCLEEVVALPGGRVSYPGNTQRKRVAYVRGNAPGPSQAAWGETVTGRERVLRLTSKSLILDIG